MVFGPLIEYSNRNGFFLKNYAENEASRLVPDLYLFLEKLNMRWKQVVYDLVLICFNSPYLLYNKNKLDKP